MSYRAPLKDMLFAMKELAGIEAVAQLPGSKRRESTPPRRCSRNAPSSTKARWRRSIGTATATRRRSRTAIVTTTPGFKQAFRQFCEGGWQGLQHPVEFGGQGLPKTIGAACGEILNSANLSFALCPLLTDGAIEALLTAGTPQQQQAYIPNMISGQWTGTMNLTEPQAGSDLSLVRTRAEPQPDGTYKLFGTKIFITYGEHDMAENIVHLVLARVSGAPEGRQGHLACSSARRCWPTAGATTCIASASSTSSASRPAPRRCCSTATGWRRALLTAPVPALWAT